MQKLFLEVNTDTEYTGRAALRTVDTWYFLYVERIYFRLVVRGGS